ncbi:uncharacterized protein JCM15063_001620 [Sporobolomyces koalae]|uniref:uncharacterized protein n=1 Tax=Sporobolomyces koalae TaxID=500713 RepID=UPI003180B0A1
MATPIDHVTLRAAPDGQLVAAVMLQQSLDNFNNTQRKEPPVKAIILGDAALWQWYQKVSSRGMFDEAVIRMMEAEVHGKSFLTLEVAQEFAQDQAEWQARLESDASNQDQISKLAERNREAFTLVKQWASPGNRDNVLERSMLIACVSQLADTARQRAGTFFVEANDVKDLVTSLPPMTTPSDHVTLGYQPAGQLAAAIMLQQALKNFNDHQLKAEPVEAIILGENR